MLMHAAIFCDSSRPFVFVSLSFFFASFLSSCLPCNTRTQCLADWHTVRVTWYLDTVLWLLGNCIVFNSTCKRAALRMNLLLYANIRIHCSLQKRRTEDHLLLLRFAWVSNFFLLIICRITFIGGLWRFGFQQVLNWNWLFVNYFSIVIKE